MLKPGIIGGLGPESTVDYYKGIISQYRKQINVDTYPHILLDSINMTEMLSYIANEDFPHLVQLLLDSICSLERAGADFAVIASNTPHIVFDELSKKSPLPLISIIEETVKKASSSGLSHLLLTGTAFTMRSTFYQNCAARYGLQITVPDDAMQKEIHSIIFPELEEGIVIPEKKKRFLSLCSNYCRDKGLDGIILGCTELPLMVNENDFNIPVLNTTQIHIASIVKVLISGKI